MKFLNETLIQYKNSRNSIKRAESISWQRDWLKEIELMIFLLKRYLVNHHQTELTVEYHNKYLKLKTLISNKDNFKDSSDWLFLKYSSNFSKKQLKI